MMLLLACARPPAPAVPDPESPPDATTLEAATAPDEEIHVGVASAVVYGADPANYFGWDIVVPGDVDGDGHDDLAVGDVNAGAGGAVYVFRGPLSGESTVADAWSTWLGGENAFAGSAIARGGNVDGDGRADLLAGAPYDHDVGFDAGAFHVVLGRETGGERQLSWQQTFQGSAADEYLGYAVAGAGDADGDGDDDVLAGAPSYGGGRDGGSVFLLHAPLDGQTLDDAAATLTSGIEDEDVGAALAWAGDLDGDGVLDVAVGATVGAGVVYVLSGHLSGEVDLADADTTLLGEEEDDAAGTSLVGVGDTDGDGLDDLAVGAPYADERSGTVYVVRGGGTGEQRLADAHARFWGESAANSTGLDIDAADLDGDGFADLLLSGGGTDNGRAYLHHGPFTGAVDLSDADLQIDGLTYGAGAGAEVAFGGDLDGDGAIDVLVAGLGGQDADGEAVGAVWILSGASL